LEAGEPGERTTALHPNNTFGTDASCLPGLEAAHARAYTQLVKDEYERRQQIRVDTLDTELKRRLIEMFPSLPDEWGRPTFHVDPAVAPHLPKKEDVLLVVVGHWNAFNELSGGSTSITGVNEKGCMRGWFAQHLLGHNGLLVKLSEEIGDEPVRASEGGRSFCLLATHPRTARPACLPARTCFSRRVHCRNRATRLRGRDSVEVHAASPLHHRCLPCRASSRYAVAGLSRSSPRTS
jgi:hypothetical protein